MHHGLYPTTRLRRMRQHQALRHMLQESHLGVQHLIAPLFIRHGKNIINPIASMPGQAQLSVDKLAPEIARLVELGIPQVILFGIPERKDPQGRQAYDDQGIIQTAIRTIKALAPSLLVTADLCFCEYTDHGHCGVMIAHKDDYYLDNDKTLTLLVEQALSLARAGADIIAPSGMMDGMVQAIRQGLDQAGFATLPIMSYAAKYASSLYGPFRQAAEGAPQFGDRRSHFMNIANSTEALHECALDIAEGADMLMVKPGHTYLDVIQRVRQAYPHMPLGAYHTSAEFAMIKAAAQQGWINERETTLEILTSIRRAGADFIITYTARDAATWLRESK